MVIPDWLFLIGFVLFFSILATPIGVIVFGILFTAFDNIWDFYKENRFHE